MVQAVRGGRSIRDVAEQFGVNASTVQRGKTRTDGKRLDRIDWSDQPDGPPRPANRSSEELEQCVLAIRKHLKEESALGEHGADAVLREMKSYDCPNIPSKATVNRILKRYGTFDARVRNPRRSVSGAVERRFDQDTEVSRRHSRSLDPTEGPNVSEVMNTRISTDL